MKKIILAAIIAVLIAVIGVASSVSVAANTKTEYTEERRIESSHGRSQHCYWTKESFTTNNRKGHLYATIITLKIPPKESSKSSEDISGSDTDAADRG